MWTERKIVKFGRWNVLNVQRSCEYLVNNQIHYVKGLLCAYGSDILYIRFIVIITSELMINNWDELKYFWLNSTHIKQQCLVCPSALHHMRLLLHTHWSLPSRRHSHPRHKGFNTRPSQFRVTRPRSINRQRHNSQVQQPNIEYLCSHSSEILTYPNLLSSCMFCLTVYSTNPQSHMKYVIALPASQVSTTAFC